MTRKGHRIINMLIYRLTAAGSSLLDMDGLTNIIIRHQYKVIITTMTT